MLGRGKKYFFLFKQISKCYTRFCSFSHKKVMGYFRFFSQTGLFFRPVLYPKKMFFNIKFFKLLFIKITKFHGDSVKNENARTKNYRGAPNAPPPAACLGLSLKTVDDFALHCWVQRLLIYKIRFYSVTVYLHFKNELEEKFEKWYKLGSFFYLKRTVKSWSG